MSFQQYEWVRIRQLLQPPDAYDGWRINQRPPQVGDTGIIAHILQAPNLQDGFVVESSRSDGAIIWLADFRAEELEPVEDEPHFTDQRDRLARESAKLEPRFEQALADEGLAEDRKEADY